MSDIVTEPPIPADDAVVPSDSGLILCFAQHFLTTGGHGARTRVPGSDALVPTRELSEVLVTAALASLLRRARAGVAQVEKKVLFVKTRSLVVKVPAGVRFEDEPRSSLEYDLLKVASVEKGEFGPRQLIRGMYGSDVADPWAKVVDFALANLIRAGLGVGHHEQQGGIKGHLQHTVLIVDWSPDKLAPLAEPAAAAWASFQAWAGAEPLAGAIRSEVASAIASRREQDDDSE